MTSASSVTWKAMSLMVWVKMGRRNGRFGDRGEVMRLPPQGCFPHVTRSLEGQNGCDSCPQHYASIPGGKKGKERWDLASCV